MDINDLQRQPKDFRIAQTPIEFMTAPAFQNSTLGILRLLNHILYLEIWPSLLRNSQAKVGVVSVQWGSLSVLEYEIGFLEQAKHNPMLYPLDHDLVHGFIRGITFPLSLALENLIEARSSFFQGVGYARTTKRACIETYGDDSKKLHHQYNAICLPFESEDLSVDINFICVLLFLKSSISNYRWLLDKSQLPQQAKFSLSLVEYPTQILRLQHPFWISGCSNSKYLGACLGCREIVIGLGSALDPSWMFRQGQHKFLSSLELMRYVTIAGRMVFQQKVSLKLIGQPYRFSWCLSILGLQGFITTVERPIISPQSVPNMGLLTISLIQINLAKMWHLQLQVVHLVPRLVIQTLNMSLDPLRFNLLSTSNL